MREGHFDHLQAKKAALLDAARKQGMSAAALARLPQPVVVKADKLPPVVLATKAHSTNFNRQDSSRRSARTRKVVFERRPKIDHAHLMAVIDVVARRFGQSGAKVCARRAGRTVTAARHVAVLLTMEVTNATQANLADAMRVSLATIKNSRDYGQSVVKNYAGYAEKYGVAKADILARWPQYRSAT